MKSSDFIFDRTNSSICNPLCTICTRCTPPKGQNIVLKMNPFIKIFKNKNQ